MNIKKQFKRGCISTAILIGVAGCATPSAITERARTVQAPVEWQSDQISEQNSSQVSQWLMTFDDQNLHNMVKQALNKNYQLQSQKVNVLLAKEKMTLSGASDFPELSLSLNNSRRKTINGGNANYNNSAELNLQLSYELDLWGKLSAEQSQAYLNYEAAQAQYAQQELTLIANVTRTWFALTQAQQLLALYKERAKNLKNNLDIIQSSYRLGLSDALDVYLTQNEVNSELARVASQEQQVKVQARQLELLVGYYPMAKLLAGTELPTINSAINLGVPAQILTDRSDIKAAWFELLALDDGLAISHKQRFPAFTLTASTGDSADELNDLLSGSALAWSLIGNLTVPLFNAGKLASLEEQARLAVVQKEHAYLETVYQAFSEVENGISNQQALEKRYQYQQQATSNAVAAEKLSFDQYMKGLVSYTTVLESQRRAFDSQTSVIQLKNDMLQNRIDLYLALGASALSETSKDNQLENTISKNASAPTNNDNTHESAYRE